MSRPVTVGLGLASLYVFCFCFVLQLVFSGVYVLFLGRYTFLFFIILWYTKRETRNSGHNVGTTAKQVTVIWTCVAKGG